MELAIEFLKLIIPAGLVLYAMYLTVQSFLKKEFENKLLDNKYKNAEVILPIRLQAYERMSLFLERIAPNSLILRLSNQKYPAKEFQHILIKEIREELNHNLSQQVYMSDELWQSIKNAIEDYIAIINQAGSEMKEDATSIDLAKRIFDKIVESNFNQLNIVLAQLKAEIQQIF